MGFRRFTRLFVAALVACAAVHLAPAARAAEFQPDCTSRAVNDYIRNNIHKGRTQRGKRVSDQAKLSLVGTMTPVARNGAKLTCWARVRVTVNNGRSALRSTTFYLTIRRGEIANVDFVMAENR
jgi:hypothetical protein